MKKFNSVLKNINLPVSVEADGTTGKRYHMVKCTSQISGGSDGDGLAQISTEQSLRNHKLVAVRCVRTDVFIEHLLSPRLSK